jgi:hypothetical protein
MHCEVLKRTLELLAGNREAWHFDQQAVILEKVGELGVLGLHY